jgi:hypothetical protein
MSDQTIRASIKTLLDAVTGIGVVHDYSRWAADEARLRALFQKNANSPLHGWEITREGFVVVSFNAKFKKVTHDYVLRGFYAKRDDVASEKLFNIVADAVAQKFIDNKLPNTEGHTLPKASLREWMLGGVLCDRAELRLSVSEMVAKTAEADQDLLKIALGQYLAPGAAVMWTPETEYALDDLVVPTVPNRHKYKCTVAGASGAAEPEWPTGPAATVVDGDATWAEDGIAIVNQAEIDI